jgi:ribosomal protein S18 acetylase RimI-like enzyme
MEIIPYSDKYKEEVVIFILSILEGEYNLYDIPRPDLYKIPEAYQKDKSNFWIALENDKIIGTIALCNYGNNRGYLKRMYVDRNFRGKGVSDKLLSTLIKFGKDNGYKEIFLGTIESMIAANKFYIKNGFQRIKTLPKDIPELGDSIFYKLIL